MAVDAYRLHEHALVQVHRPQRGGFANDRVAGTWPARLDQRPSTTHRALLVGRCQQRQWCRQFDRTQLLDRLQGQRQKRLHVGRAKAVEPPIAFGQLPGVAAPELGIAGHGVSVAGQHQPAGTPTQGCDEVVVAGGSGHRQDLTVEAERFGPSGQPFHHSQIALVQLRMNAADRWQRHQAGDKIEQAWIGHGGTPERKVCYFLRSSRQNSLKWISFPNT